MSFRLQATKKITPPQKKTHKYPNPRIWSSIQRCFNSQKSCGWSHTASYKGPHVRLSYAGREILTEVSLCYNVVYYYNCAQWYEQFLQVGRLDRALILIGFALIFRAPLYLWSSWCYIFKICRNRLPFDELSLDRLSWFSVSAMTLLVGVGSSGS